MAACKRLTTFLLAVAAIGLASASSTSAFRVAHLHGSSASLKGAAQSSPFSAAIQAIIPGASFVFHGAARDAAVDPELASPVHAMIVDLRSLTNEGDHLRQVVTRALRHGATLLVHGGDEDQHSKLFGFHLPRARLMGLDWRSGSRRSVVHMSTNQDVHTAREIVHSAVHSSGVNHGPLAGGVREVVVNMLETQELAFAGPEDLKERKEIHGSAGMCSQGNPFNGWKCDYSEETKRWCKIHDEILEMDVGRRKYNVRSTFTMQLGADGDVIAAVSATALAPDNCNDELPLNVADSKFYMSNVCNSNQRDSDETGNLFGSTGIYVESGYSIIKVEGDREESGWAADTTTALSQLSAPENVFGASRSVGVEAHMGITPGFGVGVSNSKSSSTSRNDFTVKGKLTENENGMRWDHKLTVVCDETSGQPSSVAYRPTGKVKDGDCSDIDVCLNTLNRRGAGTFGFYTLPGLAHALPMKHALKISPVGRNKRVRVFAAAGASFKDVIVKYTYASNEYFEYECNTLSTKFDMTMDTEFKEDNDKSEVKDAIVKEFDNDSGLQVAKGPAFDIAPQPTLSATRPAIMDYSDTDYYLPEDGAEEENMPKSSSLGRTWQKMELNQSFEQSLKQLREQEAGHF